MEEAIDYGELRPVPTPKKLRRPNLTFRCFCQSTVKIDKASFI